jgi:hypothetical protein
MLEDKRSHDEYGGIEYGGLPAGLGVNNGHGDGAATPNLGTTRL